MIILDTGVIIWDALDPDKLTAQATAVIAKAESGGELQICDISMWEIAMLVKRKRLEIDDTGANHVRLFLASRNVNVVPISPQIAKFSVNLGPEINSDPADRTIEATSIVQQAPIVTSDTNLRGCTTVESIW